MSNNFSLFFFVSQEDDTDCGANGLARPSVVMVTVHLIVSLFVLHYLRHH